MLADAGRHRVPGVGSTRLSFAKRHVLEPCSFPGGACLRCRVVAPVLEEVAVNPPCRGGLRPKLFGTALESASRAGIIGCIVTV
jgi:hypothetical protein